MSREPRGNHSAASKAQAALEAASDGKTIAGNVKEHDAHSTAALVVGLCSHGLALTRALAKAHVPVYAIEKNMGLPGAATNSVRHVFGVPDYTAEHLIPALIAARRELHPVAKVALLLTNDNHVRIIGEHLGLLAEHFYISWVNSGDTVLRLLRKDELERVCREQKLNYPRSVVIRQVNVDAASSLRYPVIIKPVKPLSSFKAHIAGSKYELRDLLQNHSDDLPILAQEYVAGDDSRLFFGALMMRDGEVLHSMVGRKLASYPPARGQTIAAQTWHDDQVIELSSRFFAGTRISGPVSLELKQDANGEFWVIEPTVGRTDFWAGLCIGAGFNLPVMEFELATGQPIVAPASAHEAVWYDTERAPLACLQHTLRSGGWRTLRHRQVFPYFNGGDCWPFLRAAAGLWPRAAASLRRRWRAGVGRPATT